MDIPKLDELGFTSVSELLDWSRKQYQSLGMPAKVLPLPKRPSDYTGDICSECGSPNMRRSGSCLLCNDCGSTSGGCS